MKKFFDTLKHIFEIEELRNRIFTTIWLLVIFRLGSYIVLPGVDPDGLDANTGGILGYLDVFLGGAFNRASIFALGIMPYISASIVIQLMTVALPTFQRMQREGESGRKKITQITRALTIAITLGQSIAYIQGTIPKEAVMVDYAFFTITSMIILTGGTVFCMWLGERMTERGIGNGISMLIMIGIISRFPGAIMQEAISKELGGILIFLLELIALFFVVMGTVMLTQAVRRVPLQYAKQVVGGGAKARRAAPTGARSYLPLKVNASGVMPIIFAQSLMFLPSIMASYFAQDNDTAQYIAQQFADFTSLAYNLTFGILIVLFTFFYTAITINPKQIADDLKRSGGFIPGVKPGEETAEYVGQIMDRITFPGSVFLAIVAVLPAFAAAFGVGMEFSQFYGGTSLLIMVGVIIDTIQQIDSYLLMQHYESMMETDNVAGNTGNIVVPS